MNIRSDKRMKRALFIWLLLGLSATAFSQTIAIRDKATAEPLDAVALKCDTPPASAVTDALGRADIAAFRGAARIVVLSKMVSATRRAGKLIRERLLSFVCSFW